MALRGRKKQVEAGPKSRVRMNRSIAVQNERGWDAYNIGGVYDLAEDLAASWCAYGVCEAAPDAELGEPFDPGDAESGDDGPPVSTAMQVDGRWVGVPDDEPEAAE